MKGGREVCVVCMTSIGVLWSVVLATLMMVVAGNETCSSITLTVRKECRDEWVHVTAARRVIGLRMEERPSVWRVAANILNKQSRTADNGWSSSLGVGRGADNCSP